MRTAVAVLACLGVVTTARAQAIQVEATPTRVAMFKNGFGLVTAEATAAGTGSFILSPLPSASFGSLWLSWPDSMNVRRVRTTQAWALQDVPPEEIEQVFRSQFGADSEFDAASVAVRRRVHQPVLAFDADAPDDGAPLRLTYLAQGIAWSPSYTLHLTGDEDEATLSAKAVIVNDLIDLNGTDVELIAGYPNLQFAGTPSAMSPGALGQLLNQLRQSGRADDDMLRNRMVTQNVAYERAAAGASLPSMPATPVSGEGSEDLYFYQLPAVTLAKGERGYFPLFAGDVPAEHVYTWDIPDFVDDSANYRAEQAERTEVVWHALKLTNTTGSPWTTGAASTFKAGRILGQDTLNYCAPGGTTRLRITQAVAIDAQQAEHEIERERDAERFHGSAYDRVTIRGELTLTNYTDRAVDVTITKTLSGELHESDTEATTHKLAAGLRRVNPRTQLEWTVPVEPGRDEPTKVTYVYTVYVRR